MVAKDILKKAVLLLAMIQILVKKYGEHLQLRNLMMNMDIHGEKLHQFLGLGVIHGYQGAMIQNLIFFLLEHRKQNLGWLQVEA